MSVDAFKTEGSDPIAVEIVGVGVAEGNGGTALSVEQAAWAMPELQQENGMPLEGSSLTDAATAWAESRGLVVETVAEEEIYDPTAPILGLLSPADAAIQEAADTLGTALVAGETGTAAPPPEDDKLVESFAEAREAIEAEQEKIHAAAQAEAEATTETGSTDDDETDSRTTRSRRGGSKS